MNKYLVVISHKNGHTLDRLSIEILEHLRATSPHRKIVPFRPHLILFAGTESPVHIYTALATYSDPLEGQLVLLQLGDEFHGDPLPGLAELFQS